MHLQELRFWSPSSNNVQFHADVQCTFDPTIPEFMKSEDYEKSSLLEHYAQSSLFILYGQYGLVDVG
jgi:hypothetical protein